MTTGDSGSLDGMAITSFTPTPTIGGDIAAAASATTSATTTEGEGSLSSDSSNGVVALR